MKSLLRENPKFFYLLVIVGIATCWIQAIKSHGNFINYLFRAIGSITLLVSLSFLLGYIPVKLLRNKIKNARINIYGIIFLLLCIFTTLGHFTNHRPTGSQPRPNTNAGDSWELYTNEEHKVQFLALGKPEEGKLENNKFLKVIWHVGFLPDGSNGYVEATKLKDGSLASFSVAKEVLGLREGIEQSGKTKVFKQSNLTLNGIPVVEFQTTTKTSKRKIWYGVIRMLVVGDTIFTIAVMAPKRERLQDAEILKYLNSLKILP